MPFSCGRRSCISDETLLFFIAARAFGWRIPPLFLLPPTSAKPNLDDPSLTTELALLEMTLFVARLFSSFSVRLPLQTPSPSLTSPLRHPCPHRPFLPSLPPSPQFLQLSSKFPNPLPPSQLNPPAPPSCAGNTRNRLTLETHIPPLRQADGYRYRLEATRRLVTRDSVL